MTGLIPAVLLVAAIRGLWMLLPPIPMPRRRRRPFRLAPEWYAVDAPGRHRVSPDPGRDWVVA